MSLKARPMFRNILYTTIHFLCLVTSVHFFLTFRLNERKITVIVQGKPKVLLILEQKFIDSLYDFIMDMNLKG